MSFSQHYHDEKSRRKWQNPEKILEEIGLNSGNIFIDIGCGEGFFSIPAARIVAPSGKVIGIDINECAINHLKDRIKDEEIQNAIFKVEEAEEAELCLKCADFVFFGIDLHDFKNPEKVLQKAKKMLKPTGKLIDLDWKKKLMRLGPPVWIRFSEEEAIKLIETTGFKIDSVRDSGKMHYLIVASPQ